jgi:hypothetical protein
MLGGKAKQARKPKPQAHPSFQKKHHTTACSFETIDVHQIVCHGSDDTLASCSLPWKKY